MYHPSTRLLTILELLQARGRMSGPELARRLEVSQRSIRRYIAMLQDMGIPIEAERGRYGQYRLRPGYRLPPLMLSNEEALSVALGLLLVRRAGIAVDATTVEGAFAKLDRVLPEAVRSQVTAVEETLVLEVSKVATPPVGDKLVVFSTGVKEHRRVWLRYRGQGETERELDPYGVVHRNGLWYAVGYCHLRQGVRIFRLDRVLQAELRAQSFILPEGFDVLKYVHHALATIPARYSAVVILKTTLEDARAQVPPAMATLEPTEEGILMRCTADSLEWLAHFIAGLECKWMVKEPEELREALRKLAAEILASVDR